MKVFISGIDTNIGKTTISSWICNQTGYPYFKPIQTGTEIDAVTVKEFADCFIYESVYSFAAPRSPHQAAMMENKHINLSNILLPEEDNLIVEGAGGLLVPLNDKEYVIDLIKYLSLPIILVSSCRLGTINQTLLSIEAIRNRNLKLLGVITTGHIDLQNIDAIETYGKTNILAHLPFLENLHSLKSIPLPIKLKEALNAK